MIITNQYLNVLRVSLLTLAISSFALTPHSMANAGQDLLQTLRLAESHDARYQAAIADFDAEQINVALAQSAFKPTFNTQLRLGKQRSDFVTGQSNGILTGQRQSTNDHALGFNAALTLYDANKKLDIEGAELANASASIIVKDAHDELILRVAERYFAVLAAEDALRVAKVESVAISRQLNLAKERVEVGLATDTVLFEAEARLQQAKADAIIAQLAIDNAQQALQEITNQQAASYARLSEQVPMLAPSPDNAQHWQALAASQNKQIRLARNQLDNSNIVSKRAAALRSPTVTVEANQLYSDTFTDNEVSNIGIAVNFPIYLGGRRDLLKQQATYRQLADEHRLTATNREVNTQIRSAYLATIAGLNRLEALDKARAASANALNAKEEGFAAGIETNIDVLNAQRDLSRVEGSYLMERYNFLLATLRLKRLSGELNELDLIQINRWLTH